MRHRPHRLDNAPAAVSGRGGGGGGGFKSSQLTAGACSEERKSQCQKRKCLTAWSVVVMILVQGPEQDSRRDHRLHACDSTPLPQDSTHQAAPSRGLKEASICVPTHPGAKPANSKAERMRPRDKNDRHRSRFWNCRPYALSSAVLLTAGCPLATGPPIQPPRCRT